MKELTSVRSPHLLGHSRYHFERVRKARYIPRAADRTSKIVWVEARKPVDKVLFSRVRGQPHPDNEREHIQDDVVILQCAARRTP